MKRILTLVLVFAGFCANAQQIKSNLLLKDKPFKSLSAAVGDSLPSKAERRDHFQPWNPGTYSADSIFYTYNTSGKVTRESRFNFNGDQTYEIETSYDSKNQIIDIKEFSFANGGNKELQYHSYYSRKHDQYNRLTEYTYASYSSTILNYEGIQSYRYTEDSLIVEAEERTSENQPLKLESRILFWNTNMTGPGYASIESYGNNNGVMELYAKFRQCEFFSFVADEQLDPEFKYALIEYPTDEPGSTYQLNGKKTANSYEQEFGQLVGALFLPESKTISITNNKGQPTAYEDYYDYNTVTKSYEGFNKFRITYTYNNDQLVRLLNEESSSSNPNTWIKGLEYLYGGFTALGLGEQQLVNVSLYPNPVVDKLYISGLKSKAEVKVFTIDGREIYNQANMQNGEMDVSWLDSGIYLVHIQNSDGVGTYRIKK